VLVLSRHNREKVFLDLPNGDRITIEIRDIRSNKVRISFDAPIDVRILREELDNPKEKV
jgi:carbon storage regulator CsrA